MAARGLDVLDHWQCLNGWTCNVIRDVGRLPSSYTTRCPATPGSGSSTDINIPRPTRTPAAGQRNLLVSGRGDIFRAVPGGSGIFAPALAPTPSGLLFACCTNRRVSDIDSPQDLSPLVCGQSRVGTIFSGLRRDGLQCGWWCFGRETRIGGLQDHASDTVHRRLKKKVRDFRGGLKSIRVSRSLFPGRRTQLTFVV